VKTISFKSTRKGNMIEIPEQFIPFVPRQFSVTIEANNETEAKQKGDSQILYELRADAAERGFLSDAEIEREIQSARAEKTRSLCP